MAYMPETLSEQIAIVRQVGATGTVTQTMSALDLREHHRFKVRMIGLAYTTSTSKTTATSSTKTATTTASTSVKVSLKVQVATNTGFTGATTLTTVTSTIKSTSTVTAKTSPATGTGKTTATAKATALGSVSYSGTGELVQSQRVAEDRYLRAIVVVTGGSGVAEIWADCDRYKG